MGEFFMYVNYISGELLKQQQEILDLRENVIKWKKSFAHNQ